MEDQDPFRNRVGPYMYAVDTYPHCMEEEFESMIEELDLETHYHSQSHPLRLLNLDGVASPLNRYIEKSQHPLDYSYDLVGRSEISRRSQGVVKYMVMESNREFAKYAQVPLYSSASIPLASASIHRVSANATLHHMLPQDRASLYKEILRILVANPTSRFVLGDVEEGSKEEHWLNVIVDRYNPNGHKGVFFREDDEIPLLEAAGFQVEVKRKRMRWKFRTDVEMVDFMGNLFYMKALLDDPGVLTELIKSELGLKAIYQNHEHDHGHDYDYISFDWELIYFICRLNPVAGEGKLEVSWESR